jgi:hypothetical protein
MIVEINIRDGFGKVIKQQHTKGMNADNESWE